VSKTKSRHAVKRDGSLQVAAVGATAKSLFELKTAENNLLKQFALLYLSL